MWNLLARVGASLLGKVFPDRSKVNEAQSNINIAEVSGSPPSVLRLWRSFLGWVLTILLVWEIPVRLIIIPLFFPDSVKNLPESCLNQILTLLTGMLGLGF